MTRTVVCLLASLVFPAAAALAQQTAPAQPTARFHHVHLNTTNPAAAVDFYASHFKARKEKFAGTSDAIWTGDSWLLFTKVATPPHADLVSSIWHIGWGAEDVPATYQKQLERGTRFATPLTDITAMVGSGRSFFYAYVDGPDHALIELNTAANHNFGHVHMFSADPPAAGAWYAKHFGWRVRAQTEKRIYEDNQIGPAAFVTAGHVSMIIYPQPYVVHQNPTQWQGRTDFASTRGRVIDHLGFSVDDLDATLARLKAAGVKITSAPRSAANGQLKVAFIEGPDRVGIELLEDRSARPGPIVE
jgi:catechol 2,3-dioxygenase-like lactoylglutathione lyase family enzyme